MTSIFDRQVPLLTRAGQELLGRLRVAIVGLGGTGSHVVQQLCYLGVRYFLLIDPDKLSETNRNRLIGARASDPTGISKTEIAARSIREVAPNADILTFGCDFRAEPAASALTEVDWVFGCMDDDGARLRLLERWTESSCSFVDLGTEIRLKERPIAYGGRVCVMHDAPGCLYCLGLLSPEDALRSLASPEAAKDYAGVYGVPNSELEGSGPSVVFLNGVVASLAVTEFTCAAVGLRSPVKQLDFQGHKSVVLKVSDQGDADCPYCALRFASKAA